MRCCQQKGLDVLAGRRLLEPADHEALPAVLGGLQDRQRAALRAVGQQERRPQQFLAVRPAVQVHARATACSISGRWSRIA